MNLCPKRDDYYVQTNNELDPKIACQCTAAAQCLDIIGEVKYLKGKHRQYEDNLRDYIATDSACLTFCIKSHGKDWHKSVDHMSEWPDVLVYAINALTGYAAAKFTQPFTDRDIISHLSLGLPSMVSMRYPSIPGHYVSVVGYDEGRGFIINDPYRNTLLNKPDGFNNIYSLEAFNQHFKGYGVRFLRRPK